MLGKIDWEKRRGQQKKRWLDSIIDSMDRNLSKLLSDSKEQEDWYVAICGLSKS